MRHATQQMKRGLQQIDLAAWTEDHTGTLNLYVTDPEGRHVHSWMTLRPDYCDRGHVQLNIDGPLGLDGQDQFPRYFFSFEEANHHCRTFLKWRLWKHRTYNVGRSLGWGKFYETEVRLLDKLQAAE